MEILLPVEPDDGTAPPPHVKIPSLEGAKVAVVSNLRNRTPVVAEFLSKQLPARYGVSGVELVEHEYMSTALTMDRVAAVAAGYDVVVASYGGCGSCTAALVRSASLLNVAGLPSLVIGAENFDRQIEFLGRAWGAYGLQREIFAWDFEAAPLSTFREGLLDRLDGLVAKLLS